MPKWSETRISYDFLVVNFQFYILSFFDSELSYMVWIFSSKCIQLINLDCLLCQSAITCKLSLKTKTKTKTNLPACERFIILRSVKKDGFGGHEPGEVQHFACVISHASFLLQRLACSMVSFQFILFLLELPPTLIVMANCHSKKWTNQQKIGSFKEQLCKDTFSYTVVWLTSKTLWHTLTA